MNALLEYIMNIKPPSPISVSVGSGLGASAFQPLSSGTGKFSLNIPVTDYDIVGKPVMVSMKILELQVMQMDVDEIKKQLIYRLAEEMIKANVVEFTKEPNLARDESTFRARIFVVPDTTVRTLRLEKMIK